MDWKNLFLSAQGRIGQNDFWIGFAILFVSGMILGMIPFVGLLLIYPNVCVFAKRLHDFGKTGWLYLVPIGITILLMIVGFMAGGAAMFAGAAGGDAAASAAALGSMGLLMILIVLGLIVYFGFVLWVGLAKGDPDTNAYGPPPGGLVTAF